MIDNLRFKNIHVQRMYWTITSPSLMNYPFLAHYIRDRTHAASVLNILKTLDAQPNSVDDHFNGLRHMPMGKYFEQLLFFIMEKDERFVLLLSNHQIIEDKRTIGELDLIVRDTRTEKLEHWEIALKFYLQSAVSTNQNVMLGPNAVDDLNRKLTKLKNHQLRLSEHPKIQSIFDNEPIDSKLFMKGQLFYHLNNASTISMDVNPMHETGWWCFLSEVKSIVSDNLRWKTIQKPNWIGTTQTTVTSDLLAPKQMHEYLAHHFKNESEPLLLAGMRETDNGWLETARGFVVNNNWPRFKS